jgi:hypothetical protein
MITRRTRTALRRLSGISILLLGLSVLGVGQGNQNRGAQPTEQQIAKYKRLWELLKHPTFVSVRLASTRKDDPDEASSSTPSPYIVGEKLHFKSFITQTSNDDLEIVGDRSPYYAFRPQLIRDGDVVPYTKYAQQRLDDAEHGSNGFSKAPMTLHPGREYPSNDVRLEDWYDAPLKPGHYQLTIKKRFTGDGDWVESNPVTFDVVISKSSAPTPADAAATEGSCCRRFNVDVRRREINLQVEIAIPW